MDKGCGLHIVILLLIFGLIIGSARLSLNAHYCSGSLKSISLWKGNKCCCSPKEEKPDSKLSCCAKPAPQPSVESKEDCCQDVFKTFEALDNYLIQAIEMPQFSMAALNPPSPLEDKISFLQLPTNSQKPPPKPLPSYKAIFAWFQVFRL